MPEYLVEDYRAEWNWVKDEGKIWLKRAKKKKYVNIPVKSTKGFQSLVLLLSGPKPVIYDTTNDLLTTRIDGKSLTS